MTRLRDDDGKKLAIAGVLAGLVVAGLRGRKLLPEVIKSPASSAKLSSSDWKAVIGGTMKMLGDKNLPVLAAGIAYFSTLALFPMLAAAVAIAALLITAEQLDSLVLTTQAYLPEDVSSVITTQLQNLVSQRADNIVAATIAIAIALFGASGASKNLVIASNIVYGVKESRGWLAQQFWGIIWTLVGIIVGFLFVGLLAVNQGMLEYIGLSGTVIPALLYGRWLLMVLIAILGLGVFYRYGPNRPNVRWQWVSWGAIIATVVWLLATILFFVYVQNFANYNQSYSLFAGIIVLMTWLNLSALIVLLGAAVNYQIEIVGHKSQEDHADNNE